MEDSPPAKRVPHTTTSRSRDCLHGMSGPRIPPVNDILRETLERIASQLYLDASHWLERLPLMCQRVGDISNAGAMVAGTQYLPRNVAAEITEVANLITLYLNESFSEGPPFTAPRVAELLLDPEKEGYPLPSALHVLNFLHALSRAVFVSSTAMDFDDMLYTEEENAAAPQIEQVPWLTTKVEDSDDARNEINQLEVTSNRDEMTPNREDEDGGSIEKNMIYEMREIEQCQSPAKEAIGSATKEKCATTNEHDANAKLEASETPGRKTEGGCTVGIPDTESEMTPSVEQKHEISENGQLPASASTDAPNFKYPQNYEFDCSEKSSGTEDDVQNSKASYESTSSLAESAAAHYQDAVDSSKHMERQSVLDKSQNLPDTQKCSDATLTSRQTETSPDASGQSTGKSVAEERTCNATKCHEKEPDQSYQDQMERDSGQDNIYDQAQLISTNTSALKDSPIDKQGESDLHWKGRLKELENQESVELEMEKDETNDNAYQNAMEKQLEVASNDCKVSKSVGATRFASKRNSEGQVVREKDEIFGG